MHHQEEAAPTAEQERGTSQTEARHRRRGSARDAAISALSPFWLFSCTLSLAYVYLSSFPSLSLSALCVLSPCLSSPVLSHCFFAFGRPLYMPQSPLFFTSSHPNTVHLCRTVRLKLNLCTGAFGSILSVHGAWWCALEQKIGSSACDADDEQGSRSQAVTATGYDMQASRHYAVGLRCDGCASGLLQMLHMPCSTLMFGLINRCMASGTVHQCHTAYSLTGAAAG